MIKSFASNPMTTAPASAGTGGDKLIPIILGSIALYLLWKFVIKPEIEKEQMKMVVTETDE
jgi:hypothetical protein